MAYEGLRVKWTAGMVDELRRLRNLGHDQRFVADAIGVDKTVVMHKCRELGLSGRMNRGAYRGTVERANG